ncbi:cell division protein SepF [Mollicutes bacterium LVI A0078]|nr:cell division protein SepF [Mollicutes bacterium LVI A0075]WOO90839.1 cell division protein SepF [Mollicutes bacterium LVI A0078]
MLKQFKEFMTEGDTETLHTDSFDFENEVANDEELEISAAGNMQRNVVRMFEPVSKSSADKIMTSIKRQELCIVNFKNVSEEEGNQILNQLAGAIYALDGQLIQMTGEIVVCAPKTYMLNQENIG